MNKFSLVIPFYNKSKFLTRALTSVQGQSYQFDEIIIVNDGSGLDEAVEMQRIVESFPIEICVVNINNAGVSNARNLGVAKARNSLVCLLDADDELLPCYLSYLNQVVSEYKGLALYGFGYVEYGKSINLEIENYFDSYFFMYNKLRKPPFCSSSVCLNKSIISQSEVFPLGFKMGEDIYAWVKLISQYKFFYNPTSVAVYHHDDEYSAVMRKAPKDMPPLLMKKKCLYEFKGEAGFSKFMENQKLDYLKMQVLYGDRLTVAKFVIENLSFKYILIALVALVPRFLTIGIWENFRGLK